MDKEENITHDFLTLLAKVGSVVTIFGVFAYYVGRQYTESYYEVLGIPSRLLQFSFADFVYYSFKSWAVLIAIALTALSIFLWRLYVARGELKSNVEVPGEKQGRNWWYQVIEVVKRTFRRVRPGEPQYMLVGYFIWWVFGLIVTYLFLMPMEETSLIVRATINIIMLITGIFFAYGVVTDKPTAGVFMRHKFLYYYLFIGAIIIIILSAQILPSSWGTFRGFYDNTYGRSQHVFPQISLVVNRDVATTDVEWTMQSDGTFVTQEPLFLLACTERYFFLSRVSRGSKTFIVPSESVVRIESEPITVVR